MIDKKKKSKYNKKIITQKTLTKPKKTTKKKVLKEVEDKTKDSQVITFMIPKKLVAQITKTSKRMQISRSAYVRRALKEWKP